jgi:hypothetical protein
MDTKTNLKDLYSFPGFRALIRLKPHPEDSNARVVTLRRRQKKVFVPVVAMPKAVFTIARYIVSVMFQAVAHAYMLSSSIAGFSARGARP